MGKPRVVFCIPTVTKPYQQCLDALEMSVPLIKEAGWEESSVFEIGCPYISHARATMLHKALQSSADVVVFIDHDLSWDPEDLLTLIETEGDVVAGTYRFKRGPIEGKPDWMGSPFYGEKGHPLVRESDECIQMHCVPAGFLKITRNGVNKFIEKYPELTFGEKYAPHIDLFNHGAHEGVWYGEDYAFSRRWNEKCGDIWCRPKLNLVHHTTEQGYGGTYHDYLIGLGNGDSGDNS